MTPASDGGSAETTRPRRRRRTVVLVITIVTVSIAAGGILVWKRGSEPPAEPEAASGPLELKLEESKLEGSSGQDLWANVMITGRPAFRLGLEVTDASGLDARTQLPDPATLDAGAAVGGLVTISSALDTAAGTKDIKVRARGCAKDVDPCTDPDRLEASATFAVKLTTPSADVLPIGVTAVPANRVVDRETGRAAKDEYDVITKEDLDPSAATAAAKAAAAATGGVLTGGVPAIGVFQVAYPGTTQEDWDRIAAGLKAQPGIDDVRPRDVTPPTTERIPNDYGEKNWAARSADGDAWNLKLINADKAWDLTTGTRDVKVGLIDSGIHTGHEDLKENIGQVIRYHALPPNNPSTHGTHTAGLVCAKGDNGRGVSGVAMSCTLNAYDVNLVGNVGPVEIALAMVQAVDDGNRVVNMSIGFGRRCNNTGNLGADPTPAEMESRERVFARALTYARRGNGGRGTLFVIAAGNGCTDVSKIAPASLAKTFPDVAVAVGAVNASGNIASFSNAGEGVPIAAGGGWDGKKKAAKSTVDRETGYLHDDFFQGKFSDKEYGLMPGTSQAAPQVAGVGVLVAAAHPSFTASQIRDCIVKSASRPVGSYDSKENGHDKKKKVFGRDRELSPGDMKIVDAEAAVRCGDTAGGGNPSLPPGAITPPPGGTPPSGTPTGAPTQFEPPQVVVVMDTSGSMSQTDASGKVVKIDAAKQALNDFINGLNDTTSVGLWTYPSPASTPTSGDCATAGGAVIGSVAAGTTTLDRAGMSARVRAMTADGDTPTGPALKAASAMLRGSGPRTIVLVSDGEHTCGGDPCEVARELAQQGISSIYTVGFQLSDNGKREMQCIADAAHGTYTDILKGEDLKDKIPELARAKLDMDLTLPTRTSIDIGSGQTPSAPIKVRITNSGTNDAYDVKVGLAFDTIAGSIGASDKRIGNLLKGESREVVWDFRPREVFVDRDVEFRATASALNADVPAPITKRTTVSGKVALDQAGGLLRDKTNPVIFGDSYSSGEGTFEYDPETDTVDNACHRSRSTYATDLWPQALVQGDHTRHVFACSGAIAQDVYASSSRNRDPGDLTREMPAQTTQYRRDKDFQEHPADVALLTMGGNDIGFGDIVTICVLPLSCDQQIHREIREKQLKALPQNLRMAYLAIDAQLNSDTARKARNGQIAPIVVLAYPALFPFGPRDQKGCAEDLTTGEQQWASDLGNKLNLTIFDTVMTLQEAGYPIYFAWDTYKSFRPRHTMCDGAASWINQVDGHDVLQKIHLEVDVWITGQYYGQLLAAWRRRAIDDAKFREFAAAFHPNKVGYRAMTSALVRYTNSPQAQHPVSHPPNTSVRSPVYALQEPSPPIGSLEFTGAAPPGTRSVAPGDSWTVKATNAAPFTPYEVAIESDPRAVAHGNADDKGEISSPVLIPPDLPEGDHHVVLRVQAADGTVTEQRMALAVTRPSPWWFWAIGLLGAALLVLSIVLVLLARRAQRQFRADAA